MVKCSFCGREEASFIGIHIIHNDGSVIYFCSGKCRKNAIKLKRDKRRLKWTSSYHEKSSRLKSEEQRKNETIANASSKEEIKSRKKK